ncbi:helix-hairpin-helix domain-containing protein [Streptomyces sp. NPDC050610]|uniref:helix-hairpin-helix domain-containing protein n=1 Tax=Streptomyces sp. NPDC050610 TaxID=3157097 RepID=UPI0034274565
MPEGDDAGGPVPDGGAPGASAPSGGAPGDSARDAGVTGAVAPNVARQDSPARAEATTTTTPGAPAPDADAPGVGDLGASAPSSGVPGAADDGAVESVEAAGNSSAAEPEAPEAGAGAGASVPRPTAREQDDASGGAGGGQPGRSAAAEALAAAVRAVESGERSAASFFSTPNRPKPAPAATPPSAPSAPVPSPAARPSAVPERDAARTAPPAPPHRPVPAAGLDGVRQVLAAGGAPEQLAEKAVDALGERAAEALHEDPWQLLAVAGVRPEQADGFARALLGGECGPGDERRAQALVAWLLERAALEGHAVLESSALRAALAQQSVPDPDEALQTAIADGAVLVFQEAIETPGAGAGRAAAGGDEDAEVPVRVLLGLDRYAMAEESLADGLARLINALSTDDGAGMAPEAWERAAAGAPSPSAAELIRAAAGNGLVAHTGGEAARAEPAALVAAARAGGLRAYAATHSEDGRQRTAALIGPPPTGQDPTDEGPLAPGPTSQGPPDQAPYDPAVTVSGLLAGVEGPGRDADGALALDLLVVLDAPQLDVETAAMLVESLADGARLILSGDAGTLWSAGPGRVFADVAAARVCPAVVSRTPDPGPIGELVSGIGVGELNQVEAPGKEVVIVPVRDAGEAVHRTVQLVADSVPRAIGVPSDRTQVITPGHGGSAGTRALNAALKERLNPGPGRFGGFDPGDRVAYVPAPGRMTAGTVVSADAEGLRLECAGAPVLVPRERVAETVRHGWAVTAHQAAGIRWPAAVVVLPGDAAAALNRAWVYTAFSRAERHLSVVHGVDQALPRAIAEVPAKPRTTRLRSLLQAQGRPEE